VNGSGWGGVKRDINALVDSCFDLGKNGGLFCEWVASLESCDVVNSSYKNFCFWLLDSSVKCWAEVLWVNMMGVLRICFFPSTKFLSVEYSSLVCVPLVVFPEDFYPKVVIFYFDKFNRSACFLWEVDVVSGIFMSRSVVFKVCFAFDVLWRLLASCGLCLKVHNTFVCSSTAWLLRMSW